MLFRCVTIMLVFLFSFGCKTGPSAELADERRGESVGDRARVGDRAGPGGERRVIVVSIDGCRWDYLEDEALVNLRAMREAGAAASQVKVTNPSMTAPGHVTLITGAWAGTHGIVFNKFYDREAGFVKFFGGIDPVEQTDWLLAEPVWVAAEKAGLETASVHWAATAGPYGGQKVDTALPFEQGRTDDWRISQAIDLLLNKKTNLLMIYTLGVSAMTYEHGVGAVQVRDRLREIDGLIGKLLAAVRESDMADETDVLVVSDHGFGGPLEKELCVSHLLKQQGIGFDFIGWGAIGHVFLQDPQLASVVRDLISPLEGVERVLLRAEAGALHLATENRTGDVLVVMKQGWQVANQWRPCDDVIVDVQPGYEKAGTHGYPAEEDEDMRGIFLAAGPHIRQAELGVVKQTDVAPTISALLTIPPPADADGKALDLLK